MQQAAGQLRIKCTIINKLQNHRMRFFLCSDKDYRAIKETTDSWMDIVLLFIGTMKRGTTSGRLI